MSATIYQFPVPAAFQKPVADQPALIDLPLPERDPRPLCRCELGSRNESGSGCGKPAEVRFGNELFCTLHANEFIDTEGHEFFADALHYREIEYVKERGTLDEQLRMSLQEVWR